MENDFPNNLMNRWEVAKRLRECAAISFCDGKVAGQILGNDKLLDSLIGR